jgi:hypothetical protein
MQPGVNFRVTDKKVEQLVGVKDAATSNLAVRRVASERTGICPLRPSVAPGFERPLLAAKAAATVTVG